jgi:hypothetical protein
MAAPPKEIPYAIFQSAMVVATAAITAGSTPDEATAKFNEEVSRLLAGGTPTTAQAAQRMARADTAAKIQAAKLREGNEKAAAAAALDARKAEIEAGLKETEGELDPRRLGGKRRSGRRVTAKRFCGCVKKVVKSQKKKEGSAIAICTSSLLWPHGRTLHSVACRSRKASIKTQKRTLRKK